MIRLLRTREWLDATRAKTPCDHDALPSLCQIIDEIDETVLGVPVSPHRAVPERGPHRHDHPVYGAIVSIDFGKYPNLRSTLEHPPTCPLCGDLQRRHTFPSGQTLWVCDSNDCPCGETDAEVDNRLQSDAEAAHERSQVV